jgi:hypothetical protein
VEDLVTGRTGVVDFVTGRTGVVDFVTRRTGVVDFVLGVFERVGIFDPDIRLLLLFRIAGERERMARRLEWVPVFLLRGGLGSGIFCVFPPFFAMAACSFGSAKDPSAKLTSDTSGAHPDTPLYARNPNCSWVLCEDKSGAKPWKN